MDSISIEALWAWGRLWHFPYIPLRPDPIRHGRDHWHRFLETMTPTQREALGAHIERWNRRAQGYAPDPLDEEVEQEWNAHVLQKTEIQIGI